MSEHLLEYEIDLYKNRFRLGVPSRFVEKAEQVLTEGQFREFLEYVHEATYSTAASVFAKVVKDNNVEITDEVRGLYENLKRVRLKGDKEVIPDFANENIRQEILGSAGAEMLDPEELLNIEKKLKQVLDAERMLLKVADRAGISPAQAQKHVKQALDEIQQLIQILT